MAEKNSSTFVTVACKIGVSWIDYEVCELRDFQENTQTGPRTVKQAFRTGEKVRIRGTAYPRGEPPEGFPERPQMVMGYALTHGVKRSSWEIIADQHKHDAAFVSGMIYAYGDVSDIASRAKDHEKQLSGLEPIARAKIDGHDTIVDERMPRSRNANISSVEPGKKAA